MKGLVRTRDRVVRVPSCTDRLAQPRLIGEDFIQGVAAPINDSNYGACLVGILEHG